MTTPLTVVVTTEVVSGIPVDVTSAEVAVTSAEVSVTSELAVTSVEVAVTSVEVCIDCDDGATVLLDTGQYSGGYEGKISKLQATPATEPAEQSLLKKILS